MENLSTDIVELIIKLIMIGIIIGLFTQYERLKELLFLSKYSNRYHSYHAIADGIDATQKEVSAMHRGLIEKEKKHARIALQIKYPKKSNTDIDKIINEYYA